MPLPDLEGPADDLHRRGADWGRRRISESDDQCEKTNVSLPPDAPAAPR